MLSLTVSQAKALEALNSGANVFLTGEAGTGKSFVLRHYLDAQTNKKNILVCAPTGVAAQNVHGATLHSVFSIPTRPLSPNEPLNDISSTVRKADIIVIDEISMCRFDVFQFVARYILEAERLSKRSKQLIVVGDFFQLPPVITPYDAKALKTAWRASNLADGFAFMSPYWRKFDFNPVALSEQVRQRGGADFTANLNKIRRGDTTSVKWFKSNCANTDKTGIYLFPRNENADAFNVGKISQIPGEEYIFKAIIKGVVEKQDKHAPEILSMKAGMRVMSLANDLDRGLYQNGSLGTVLSIDPLAPSAIIAFDNGNTAEIGLYTYPVKRYGVNEENMITQFVVGSYTQFPLRPGYATTIHKSQGQTFENAVVDPSCFAAGQLYVALSRLTGIAGLYLLRDILPKYVKASKTVTAFYNSICA